MDYIKEYKSFINSHYLNDAVRITVGIVLPSVLLGYFHNLSTGIVVSIGALCVGNTDNPGPIHHRRNGMMACIIILFIASLLTGAVAGNPLLTGILVFVFCFVFSMMSIYGNRASSIGVNALLVMVLSIDRPQHGWEILVNALYILAGGTWYMVLSLLLYSFRPYKLIQQALGECIEATADYLRIKASFYNKSVDHDKSYRQLVQQQIDIHGKQELLRELLFKSRDIVKETTHIGRVLLMVFLDIVDLFERVMTSQQDYISLHQQFDGSGLMEEYERLILDMASELEEIGIALKSGKPSVETSRLTVRIKALRETYTRFRDEHRSASNVEGLIGLRHILDSIQDIADRLHTLHGYTTYDARLSRNIPPQLDYEQFISHQDIDKKLLWDNLTFKSNIFRHSLRVSIATIAGYLISFFLPFGHGYWILLTIIVILKPAYSLTKRRNYERLTGTLAGALVGLLLLFFIKDKSVLFVLMILFMIGAYAFIRTNYLICVTMTTPYVLLLFHLLYPVDFRSILLDRVIDTAIGSAIAFIANIFIVPSWEREQLRDYMISVIQANAAYFRDVTGGFAGRKPTENQYKLSRKEAFVALANLSDAFNRILSEPGRNKEVGSKMHQFVVSNHMLTAHIATLAYYELTKPMKDADPAIYAPVVDAIIDCLDHTTTWLKGDAVIDHHEMSAGTADPVVGKVALAKTDLRLLNDRLGALLDQRKGELGQGITDSDTRQQLSAFKPVVDQFNFIVKVTGNIEQLSLDLAEKTAAA